MVGTGNGPDLGGNLKNGFDFDRNIEGQAADPNR